MEQKNVKGYVGLCAALLSWGMIVVSWIPMTPLKPNPSITFFGSSNVTLGAIALLLTLIAIIVGAMSTRHKDRRGPRKSGIIIGVLALIIGLGSIAITSTFSQVTAYINGEPSILDETVKNDPNAKEELDELIEQIVNSSNAAIATDSSQTESSTTVDQSSNK